MPLTQTKIADALEVSAGAVAPDLAGGLMDRLGALLRVRGLDSLAERLRLLGELSGADLLEVEATLQAMPRGQALVTRAATHLLDLGGKRLRPLCVALSARAGRGFSAEARELAVCVELVHSATLLHDDVVDLGELRRGAPSARAIYGNAASIFAGDWLLVDALRRVRLVGLPGLLERLLEVIQEMILAESTQLENRGRVNPDRAAYFHVVEGKTASLFRWAMFAGGRAGGLGDAECRALEAYGHELGVAFQAIDDLLDFCGGHTGKALFVDLREGKMTYPLILALEREPALRGHLEEVIALPADRSTPEPLAARIVDVLGRTGSVEACRAFARERAARAVESIAVLPSSEAKVALETVAQAAVDRDR